MEYLVIIGIFIITYWVYSFITNQKNRRRYGVPTLFKKSYEKILVPINRMNIISRDYYEDDERGFNSIKSLDSLDSNRQIRQVHKYISIIEYNDFLYNGRKYSFKSVPIDMSDTEIREFLSKENTINVYFDKDDLTKHYFDLSILSKYS